MRFFTQIANINNIVSSVLTSSAASTDLNMVFDGDSLTRGEGAGGYQVYPYQIFTHYETIFKTVEWHSFGVGGQTTSQMLTDRATQVLPLANPAKFNILFLWEDVNALFQKAPADAQLNYDQMKLYAQDAKNAGYQKVVLLTSYHFRADSDGIIRQGTTDASHVQAPGGTSDILEIYFDLVTNSNPADVAWDHHIDLRNAPFIGGVRNQIKDDVYFADFIHLKLPGYNIVRDQVIAYINSLFNI